MATTTAWTGADGAAYAAGSGKTGIAGDEAAYMVGWAMASAGDMVGMGTAAVLAEDGGSMA